MIKIIKTTAKIQKAQIIKRTINSGKYLPSEIMKVKYECHLTIGALTNR